MFQSVLHQILIMLILIAVGFISAKTGLIGEKGSLTLSNILMMVVNPALIFISFQMEPSPEIITNIFLALAIGGAVMVIGIVLTRLIIRKGDRDRVSMERFFSVYGNSGFIGIPLVNYILGSEGVICLSGFLIIFNVLVWTHGYVLMSGKADRKQLMKGILSPTMFSIVIGFIFFIFEIHLPEVVLDSVNYIADMNTPLAMIIAGSALAGAKFLTMLKTPGVYLVTVFKLLVMPLIALALLHIFRVDHYITYTVLVAQACPCATVGVAFALKFGKDETFASEMFVFSTLVSMITMPLMILLGEMTGL